jgi:hypothetical protein
LAQLGPSAIHRMTFKPVSVLELQRHTAKETAYAK